MDSLFWMQQQVNRFDQSCATAEAQVRRAQTLADVVRAAHVVPPPELRAMRNSSIAFRKLHACAERRLAELVSAQLVQLEKATLDVAESLFARYQSRDWQVLRGAYARVLQQADRDARLLLGKKRKASL